MEVGIRELRDNLTHYLAKVRRGQEIVVTDRGRPVAVVRPVREKQTLEDRLRRLEAEGKVKMPKRWAPLKPYRGRPLRGRLLSELVLEERDQGW